MNLAATHFRNGQCIWPVCQTPELMSSHIILVTPMLSHMSAENTEAHAHRLALACPLPTLHASLLQEKPTWGRAELAQLQATIVPTISLSFLVT